MPEMADARPFLEKTIISVLDSHTVFAKGIISDAFDRLRIIRHFPFPSGYEFDNVKATDEFSREFGAPLT